jgi:5-aminopentanamidase
VTSGVLRVAAAQAASEPGDVAANVSTAVSLVGAAADRGARVVVLPELFLTGYDPGCWDHDGSLSLDDPVLEPLAEAAAGREVVVVAGAAVRRALDASTLSLLVVDTGGGVSAPYDKQHVDRDERWFFSAGDHGASVLVDGWELGLGVCYDGCFPEHAAAAAAAGATAYLCPAAYYTGFEHRRDLYYAARALDNGIYVVMAGLAGTCGKVGSAVGAASTTPRDAPSAGSETRRPVSWWPTSTPRRSPASRPGTRSPWTGSASRGRGCSWTPHPPERGSDAARRERAARFCRVVQVRKLTAVGGRGPGACSMRCAAPVARLAGGSTDSTWRRRISGPPAPVLS